MSAVVPSGQTPSEQERRTPVAWLGSKRLTVGGWCDLGATLGRASRGSNWWLGDWVRFGQSRYGAKYDLAVRVTGYDVQTLTNMVYVASRFEFSRRRENVSWSIHAELAPLEPEQQEHWLDLAASTALSVRALRTQLRQRSANARPHAPPTVYQDVAPTPAPRGTLGTACPNCGALITWTGADGKLTDLA